MTRSEKSALAAQAQLVALARARLRDTEIALAEEAQTLSNCGEADDVLQAVKGMPPMAHLREILAVFNSALLKGRDPA